MTHPRSLFVLCGRHPHAGYLMPLEAHSAASSYDGKAKQVFACPGDESAVVMYFKDDATGSIVKRYRRQGR